MRSRKVCMATRDHNYLLIDDVAHDVTHDVTHDVAVLFVWGGDEYEVNNVTGYILYYID